MNFFNKYLLVLLLWLFTVYQANSQPSNGIKLKFMKEQALINPNKTFFNVLTVKNNSDQEKEVNIKLNYPKNWVLIGSSSEDVTLQAHSEINLPVRIAVSKDAKGGVGYALVALVTDREGIILDTKYSFLTIPISSTVDISTLKKIQYFDHKSNEASFSIEYNNKGNIDEVINSKFIPDKTIKIDEKESMLIEDVKVPMNSTKTVSHKVKLMNEGNYKMLYFHNINASFSTQDTIINKKIWFEYLDWKYDNSNNNRKKPLNISLAILNLFNNNSAYYRGRVWGEILLKNHKDIDYSFSNIKRDPTGNNPWINTYGVVKFQSPKWKIYLGDDQIKTDQIIQGRGISVSHIGKRNTISGSYSRNVLRPVNNYSSSLYYRFKKPVEFGIGGLISDDLDQEIFSYLGFGRLSLGFKNTNISSYFGYSERINNTSNLRREGWSYKLDFGTKTKKFDFKISTNYATPSYVGLYKGRNKISAYSDYNVSLKHRIQVIYNYYGYQPEYRIDNEYFSDRYTNYQQLNVNYVFNFKKNIQLIAGPTIKTIASNSFISIPVNSPFVSYHANGKLGVRYFDSYVNTFFSFSFHYGVTNIHEYPVILNEQPAYYNLNHLYFETSELKFYLKRRAFGLFVIYRNGPYNFSQQYAYFYGSIYSKSLSIVPSYEQYFFNNSIRLITRANYISNITSKHNQININTTIDWFAKREWTFSLLNSLSFQQITENTRARIYSTVYFQFQVSKAFDINHPRIKFHDMKAVYYKDLNGNRTREANEPGIPLVLSNIERADPESDRDNPNYNNEFYPTRLLSNDEGTIEYISIPEGEYNIKYNPQNKNLGSFESESAEKNFVINKDTVIDIPFIERNKLFGKVSLNRTKHSALGEIPIDNIKITVEGNNKTYSSLTDKDGNFEMFIPVADYYKVKINNIFSEHFDIRQEYFIVKFNGYKQFEISFDFDEKERTIAFDESDFLVDDDDVPDDDFSFDDIKVIKQTNLKGVIRDANSLLPQHATISIYNSNTNQLISETASSKRTGVYFTSFFAGDKYYIKASAKGYWVVKDNLNIQQVTTFENLTKDILLNRININDEIRMDNLKFKQESAELSPLAKAELDDMLSTLYLNPSIIIEISGHVDNIEALLADVNRLSESRAKNVAAYLVSNGLKENRIKIIAKGNTDPKSKEDTENGREQNRRVDIKVAGY